MPLSNPANLYLALYPFAVKYQQIIDAHTPGRDPDSHDTTVALDALAQAWIACGGRVGTRLVAHGQWEAAPLPQVYVAAPEPLLTEVGYTGEIPEHLRPPPPEEGMP